MCAVTFSFTAVAEWKLVESVLSDNYGSEFMLNFNCKAGNNLK